MNSVSRTLGSGDYRVPGPLLGREVLQAPERLPLLRHTVDLQ